MESESIKKRSGGKFANIMIGSFIVLGIVLATLSFLIKEPVDPPRPAMPSPNAFDAYSNAALQQLDSNKIDFAGSAIHTSGNVDDHEYTLSQQKKLIVENAPAFEEIRRGVTQQYYSPASLSSPTGMKSFSEFRRLARMMWLDAKLKGDSGEWSGAANSYLDSIQFGVQVPRGGNVITSLVGIAIQSGGRKGLKQVIPNLSAVEAKSAVNRMETILSTQTSFLETLREESRSMKAEAAKSIPNVPILKPLYMGYYSNGMKRILAEAQKPYSQRSLDPKAEKSNIFYAMVADTWLKTGFVYEQNNVNLSFLSLTLGLHAYKKDHGNYPGALEALVPAYLNKLPDDPFALKGTFKYQLTGDKYLLYSVGPDGKDDGGKAIDVPNNPNAKTNKFARYYPDEKSVGDIVAGTNDF